jgi:hypothetical protein
MARAAPGAASGNTFRAAGSTQSAIPGAAAAAGSAARAWSAEIAAAMSENISHTSPSDSKYSRRSPRLCRRRMMPQSQRARRLMLTLPREMFSRSITSSVQTG